MTSGSGQSPSEGIPSGNTGLPSSLRQIPPFSTPLPKTGYERGIDLNLIELVNGSDGQTSANMHFYREAQASLAKQQHKLSRMAEHAKKEGRELHDSRNYQKQRRKVAYIHRKVARQREDYLHVLSKHEVENQDFIAAKDLKVKNLVQNHRLAKAVSDAGWGSFLTKLSYKAEAYGKEFVQVLPGLPARPAAHAAMS